jgi:hypothetical protein
MQSKIIKKVFLNLTLDSSEMIMFNQGGQHKITFNPKLISDFDYDELEITVQMERDSQGRFEFITSEASKCNPK